VGTEKWGREIVPHDIYRRYMKFYNIKDDYITFLQNYDSKWKVTNMNEAFFINVVDRPTEEQLKKRGNISG
jgi:cytochrome b involved in lipid metabolism